MNKLFETCRSPRAAHWLALSGIAGFLALAPLAHADATVKTLGGGRLSPDGPDYGFSDGDSLQMSQFHTPFGCAVDAANRVFVADRDNGALRRLDVGANRCRTLLTGLNQPVAVAIDTNNVVYVLTRGDGAILKYDRGVPLSLASGLFDPTAMAYDGAGLLYVTQSNGSVVRVRTADGVIAPTSIIGLNNPGGIAVLDSGLVAVSETGASRIGIWDPASGNLDQRIGVSSAGFADGPATMARFNQPYHLAKTPGGGLLVADRGNQRVRFIDSTGFVTTFYGVDPNTWEGPACTSCDPIILPGWFDSSVENAEAREPVGVTVGADGTVYTTEVYYHLVRQVSGGVFASDPTSPSTNLTVLPPIISPVSGYFPMGQTISVVNPNSSSFLPTAVYYTTDGTEPTTNSLQVQMSGGTGAIAWQEKMHDLTGLRLKAFLGTTPSATVSGQAVTASEIGVPQDLAAGAGSSAIIPIVLNLRTNDQLQSLQFRVEITPNSPSGPMIPETLAALSFSTNDFIPLYTAAEAKGPATFKAASYSFGQTRGLVITYVGTNANFFIKSFGVAGLLSVPIPPGAHTGDTYRVETLNPSGTADAAQQIVALSAMPARTLTVSDARYLVGDSSAATWYNALQVDSAGAVHRGFGDGVLDNSDVNNAFAAAMGLRVPFPNTDLFDALDAFPEDTAVSAGGDGIIRYLDWQVILMRSLGLETAHWERGWSEGGARLSYSGTPGASANTPGQTLTPPTPGNIWNRQVTLSAGTIEHATSASSYDVPVYVQVAPGCQLAGLAFRVTVEPAGATPPIITPVQFIPDASWPAPPQNSSPNPAMVMCGWPLVPSASFDPALRGSNLLGHVRVRLPSDLSAGQSYMVRFANADGSPDLQTQYNFETKPGAIWVLSPVLQPPSMTSDDWKLHFFGSLDSADSADDADPDHDGVPNWAEYLAGTNPLDAQSSLRLEGGRDPQHHAPALRWLSAPGKVYVLEACSSLAGASWQVVASNLLGDGNYQQWTPSQPPSGTQFYRIRLQP